ncbi:hypothetical protein E1262_27180 [Jiangella aurantiaca]|uniref:DUF4760 domain-containing protein n=1 Tax=Jiangella aurantiaca TaxID=2530373 RepID=A0A4R5A067_9ACTN|nr:hypothetical protein [Jiangella aurantiaca]TDD64775.1 hypothetical protein E1262_27180 [Jiangella aurantiaca]
MEVIIGAAIALAGTVAGTVLTQLWQARRERDRWEWEAQRRFYDRRADIYQDFVTTVRGYAEAATDWSLYREGEPPSGQDLNSAYTRLFGFKIYGSEAAYELGEKVVHALGDLLQSDGDESAGYEQAEKQLLKQIKIDLDIADGAPDRRAAVGPRRVTRWTLVRRALTKSGPA